MNDELPETVIEPGEKLLREIFTEPEAKSAALAVVEKKEDEFRKVRKPAKRRRPDPDRYIKLAKQLVVDNHNNHHDADQMPRLTVDMVHIVWYAKVLGNWKAIIASPVRKGLLYEVSFDGEKNEAYVDVYRKINNSRVPIPAEKES